MVNSKYDIIIVGASHAGGALAASLANSALKIALIDHKPLIQINDTKKDFRTIAVANHSAHILNELGIWENLGDKAGKIEQIRITDNNSPLFLHFNNNLVHDQILGYIVENHDLLGLFHKKIQQSSNIAFYQQSITKIEQDHYSANVELDNGEKLSASLLIAADGRMSKIRETLNFEIHIKDYNHTAMIGFVEHQKPHRNIAIEKFHSKTGPFAVLPMFNQHQSNIVWTEESNVAKAIMALDPVRKQEIMFEKFGDFWGDLKLVSNLYGYPLNMVKSKNYYKGRVLLFGDAAHGIHPIAGQGYNLTIRDLEVLNKLLQKQAKLGGDLGDEVMLSEYEKLRKSDDTNMIIITDLLNSLFLSDNPLVKVTRQLGLKIVDNITPLKKFFMNYAMGKRQ